MCPFPPKNNFKFTHGHIIVLQFKSEFLYKGQNIYSTKFYPGRKKTANNSHSVIDRPESVSLVSPPTMIITEMIQNIKKGQEEILFFNEILSIYMIK